MRQGRPDLGAWSKHGKRFGRIIPQLVLAAGCALIFAVGSASAQISPGSLSKAHESLNGAAQCNSCHQFGAGTPLFKCLDCHKEVAEALSNKHGYHFQLQMRIPNGKDCVRCHLEHNGESFRLVRWEPSKEKFDHRLTGYKLDGKHAGVACEKCHTPGHMIPALRELIQYKNPAKSFFAQSTTCTPCHADPHKGGLGNECTKCHNVESWKAAKEFHHSRTRYPLTGLHSKVPCEKCHKPDAPGGSARYKDMQFGKCSDCHVDPHRGEFKKACDACHATSSWKAMLRGYDFDHFKTRYPLTGKHLAVACSACHLGGDFKKEIRFANCKDCHTPGPHKGQFDARPRKGECAECHAVDGWKPSTFGVKEHDASKYPLKGKHIGVDCAKCHAPAGKDAVYRLKSESCSDCHKDVHDNQFAATPAKGRCEDCHTVVDWRRSTYTIARHRNSRFPLAGAHVAVPCADCHKAGLGGRTDRILPFHFDDRACAACHTDPHNGEFDKEMSRTRANGTPFGCEACHSVKSWADINGFDHSKTKFPLLGAHRTVPCADCHKPAAGAASRFKGTSPKCEDCHADAHDGQFRAQDNTSHCADCHNATHWKPSTFDHAAKAHFPLTGGHANVACDKCHKTTRTVAKNEIVVYKSVPNKCAACHGAP